MLAAKASLCVRVDALGEEGTTTIGLDSKIKVEERLRQCEQDKVGLMWVGGTLYICTYLLDTEAEWHWKGTS